MRRQFASWCIAASAVVALAACSATSDRSATPTPASSGPPVVTAVPTAPPISTPPTTPPTTVAPTKPVHVIPTKPPVVPVVPLPTTTDGRLTLSGEIFSGAEPTCLLLTQQKVTYLLLAPDSAQLHAGARVVVTGKLAPNTIATHCMEGKPFDVATSEILGPNN